MFVVKRNLADNPPSPCCEWNVQLQETDELEVKVKSIAYLEWHQEVCPKNRQCHVHLSSVFFQCTLPHTLAQCLRKCLRMPTRIAKGAYARGF